MMMGQLSRERGIIGDIFWDADAPENDVNKSIITSVTSRDII